MIYIMECNCLIRPIVYIIKVIYNLLKIMVPVGLILFGMFDLIKAIISKNDDGIKKSQNSLIKKVIAAVFVFVIFIVVDLTLTILERNDIEVGDWLSCWQNPGTVDSSCTNIESIGGQTVPGGIDSSGGSSSSNKTEAQKIEDCYSRCRNRGGSDTYCTNQCNANPNFDLRDDND